MAWASMDNGLQLEMPVDVYRLSVPSSGSSLFWWWGRDPGLPNTQGHYLKRWDSSLQNPGYNPRQIDQARLFHIVREPEGPALPLMKSTLTQVLRLGLGPGLPESTCSTSKFWFLINLGLKFQLTPWSRGFPGLMAFRFLFLWRRDHLRRRCLGL